MLVKAMGFPVVMYGCESSTIKLSAKELMLLNCGVGEESFGMQGDQSWVLFIGRTHVEAETPIL